MQPADASECVFCGQPIGADQPMVGRGPTAAHAGCADAALADDAHWDAIAAGAGESAGDERSAADEDHEPVAGRSGCLMVVLALAAIIVAIALVTRTIPF
jgi:hypothetical protein